MRMKESGREQEMAWMRHKQLNSTLIIILLMNQVKHIKIVIVGDGSIGKTCIMVRFTEQSYNSQYIPTVFDNKTQDIVVAGHPVLLSLWDTAGQEAYSRLRSVAYPNTDIFLIAFSVANPESLSNAKKYWLPEIKREVPSAKIMFVGSKIDLRGSQIPNNSKNRPLQRQELQKHLRQQFNAHYVECSALMDIGVKQIFTEAAKLILIDRGMIQGDFKKSISKPPQQQPMKEQKYCGYCQLM